MQQVLTANKLKKIEKRKFSQANPLPDFFHYEGESPKVKRNNDGAIIKFSTPVKLWMDNEDNYSHLYYRSEEHTFHCAVHGCDFSNAPPDHRNGNMIKHIHNKHPEYCAYEDLPDWYKTIKATEWQSTTVVADTVKLQTSGKVSSFYSPISLDEAHKDNLLESISLGFWGLNFGSSHAGKHLLSHWGKGKVFSGAGRTAMTLHAKKRHNTIIEKKSASFAAIKKSEERSNSTDNDALNRFHSLMQDIWSNAAGDAFLGLVDTFMDVADEEWKIVSDVLGCTPFPEDHTARNNLGKIREVIAKYGLSEKDCLACTQDTTSSSFNVFNDVDFVAQLPCFAHLLNLVLKHSIGEGPLKDALKQIRHLVVCLKGSPKRKQVLQAACARLKIKYKAPQLNVEVNVTYLNKNLRMILESNENYI